MKLKSLLFFLFIHLISSQLHAQSSIMDVKKDVIIGNYLKNNTPILATEYIFKQSLYKYSFDSLTLQSNILLRQKEDNQYSEKGTLLAMDLSIPKVKWAQAIKNNCQSIHLDGNNIYEYSNGTIKYNLDNGDNSWKTKHHIFFTNEKKNIGFAYKKNYGQNSIHDIVGIDLRNGDELWQTTISSNTVHGIPSIFNDSMLLIKSGGLHAIHAKSGKGWDLNSEITRPHKEHMYTKYAVTYAVGPLLAYLILPKKNYTYIDDIQSNAVKENEYIYYASKNRINKLTVDGKQIWELSLPNELTSKSEIILTDEYVYLVNNGFAVNNEQYVFCGYPFILVLDKKSGQKVNYLPLMNKNSSIKDAIYFQNKLFFIYNQELMSYDGKTNYLHKSKNVLNQNHDYYILFQRKPLLYETKENNYNKLNNSENIFIITPDNLIEYTTNLNFVRSYDNNKLYLLKHSMPNYSVYNSYSNHIVLDNNKQLLAKLNIKGQSYFVENQIYNFNNNKLTTIVLDTNSLEK